MSRTIADLARQASQVERLNIVILGPPEFQISDDAQYSRPCADDARPGDIELSLSKLVGQDVRIVLCFPDGSQIYPEDHKQGGSEYRLDQLRKRCTDTEVLKQMFKRAGMIIQVGRTVPKPRHVNARLHHQSFTTVEIKGDEQPDYRNAGSNHGYAAVFYLDEDDGKLEMIETGWP